MSEFPNAKHINPRTGEVISNVQDLQLGSVRAFTLEDDRRYPASSLHLKLGEEIIVDKESGDTYIVPLVDMANAGIQPKQIYCV